MYGIICHSFPQVPRVKYSPLRAIWVGSTQRAASFYLCSTRKGREMYCFSGVTKKHLQLKEIATKSTSLKLFGKFWQKSQCKNIQKLGAFKQLKCCDDLDVLFFTFYGLPI